MTVYELMRTNESLLRLMELNGVGRYGADNIALYGKWLAMKGRGDKTAYVVAVLAEEFGLSQRMVYNIVGQMRREVRFE